MLLRKKKRKEQLLLCVTFKQRGIKSTRVFSLVFCAYSRFFFSLRRVTRASVMRYGAVLRMFASFLFFSLLCCSFMKEQTMVFNAAKMKI